MPRFTNRRTLPIILGLSAAGVLITPAVVFAMPSERTLTSSAARVAVAAAPGDTVTTNSDPGSLTEYWTSARLRGAQELSLTRTDAVDMSYGSANLDFSRSRITPQTANATAHFRTVGKLFFTEPGVGDFQCSASVIARRIVITAAHCVNSGHGFYTNWAFIPGYDGSRSTLATQRPFGTWAWSSAEVPTNWLTTDGALPNDTDFAAIVFQDQPFGGTNTTLAAKVGKFSVSLNHLGDTAVTMLGYPCNFDSCNIMQRVDTSDHRVPPGAPSSNAREYGSDMTGGSSGGPWVENFGAAAAAAPSGGYNVRNSVAAVTSYGYTDGGSALVLGASNLDSRWTTIYNSRCAAAVGNC